jgi:hypothetical protein
MKEVDLRDMFKKALMSICAPIVTVPSDPLSPNPLTSSAMKTQKTRQKTLMTLN